MASLNTHDTPPFATWWQGLDIIDRRELSLLDEAGAGQEMEHCEWLKKAMASFLQQEVFASRPDGLPSVMKATLAFLGAALAKPGSF